jgi:hypothetical protein
VGKSAGNRRRESLVGVDGRITLRWCQRNRMRGRELYCLAQDSVKCRAVVTTVMNLRVP